MANIMRLGGGGGGKPKKLLSSLTEGSLVSVLEAGKLTPFYVAKHNYEADLNGEGRTLLVRKDVHSAGAWNTSNSGAYAGSTIDNWLNNDYKAMLSAIVQANIGTTKFEYTIGNGNATLTTLQRSVFMPSVTEIGITYQYANVEGEALPIASILTVAKYNGTAVTQWTRSGRRDSANFAVFVTAAGTANVDNPNNQNYYRRPCFTLPADMALTEKPYGNGSWGLADEADAVPETYFPQSLWANASPTSAFGDQTVALNGSEYEAYLVKARWDTTTEKSQITLVRKSSSDQILSVTTGEPNFALRFIKSATDSGMTFSYYNGSGTGKCIPTHIWGVNLSL